MNIVLFGEMGSGKSSVATYLADKYNYTKCSLGEKIHSECELYNKHDREHLQKYGQMMREVFGEYIWCDYLYERCKHHDKIVIDDGRQLNEFEYFTIKGFLPVAVIADKDIRIERLQKRVNYKINPESFNHETEVQARKCIEMCEIKIENNGSMVDLIDEVERKIIDND